ncbi:mutator type transposase [Tanacetum coccineum]
MLRTYVLWIRCSIMLSMLRKFERGQEEDVDYLFRIDVLAFIDVGPLDNLAKRRVYKSYQKINHGKFIHRTNEALASSQTLAMEAGHAQMTPFHVVTTLISQVWNKVKTLVEMHIVAPVLNEILDWLIPRSKLHSLSVDSNEPKDISKTWIKLHKNGWVEHWNSDVGCTPKSLTLEIHHGRWFTPTPSRSYIGGHVSSVNVVDIDVKSSLLVVARPIAVESVVDPFDGLDEILGTSSTTDDFSFEKFKEVEVEADTELKEEESDTEGNDTSGSDSKDLDYDPKHYYVFDDDENIVEEVHVNINNFSFTIDPKHDTSIGAVDVQEDDLNVIDYDSFGSDLDDEIDSERRIKLRELRRLIKQKKQGFLVNHVIKSLATNPDIPVRAVQDQMQKQFEVGVSKMKAFKAKRI